MTLPARSTAMGLTWGSVWLDVSPQWLRYGEADTAPARALRQESAAYRADPAWVSRKYDALNDAHKKMVAELLVALLRLERKR